MRILGVNGIHNWSWSKDSFTDRFLNALSHRHDVVDIQYPRMWALLAYSEKAIQRRADKIIENNREGDVLIAHSFGCLAGIYAMRRGAKFSKVIFFGAAADIDIAIPHNFDVLYNIHSPNDIALSLGAALPAHDFGGMGKHGYQGNNDKVINVPANGYGHSDYSHVANICEWVKLIEDMMKGDIHKIPVIANMRVRKYQDEVKFGRV